MIDGSLETGVTPVKVEFSKWTAQLMSDGYNNFVTDNAVGLSTALKANNQEALHALLVKYQETLPKDRTFREIASFMCARRNGDLYVTTAQGSIDQVDAQRVGDLLDEMLISIPVDTQDVLFVHTHPSPRATHGPFAFQKPGWSEPDKRFLGTFGSKLRVYDLEHAGISLLTADRNIILDQGKNEGRAWGWSFPTEQPE